MAAIKNQKQVNHLFLNFLPYLNKGLKNV